MTTTTSQLTRQDVGFLLAKASQRWNELLHERFRQAGFGEVRPAYGSVLVPLFEADGLRIGEIARRARLSKQTLTTLVRLAERDGLVVRRPDPDDGRATLVCLTDRARELEPVAERALEELHALIASSVTACGASTLARALSEVAEMGGTE